MSPDWFGMRIGKLTARAILVDRLHRFWGVLFQCDCRTNRDIGTGRGLLKVPLRWLTQNKVPFGCRRCCPKKVKSRKTPSLRKRYPKEWVCWKYQRRQKGWPTRWRTFQLFLRDMGEKPEGYVLARRNIARHHSRKNSYWAPVQHNARELLLDGEQITPSYLLSRYGIRKSFTRNLQRQGLTDARLIITRWQNRWHKNEFPEPQSPTPSTESRSTASEDP